MNVETVNPHDALYEAQTLVFNERQRQINQHGYDDVHDDGHDYGQMGDAAAAYFLASSRLHPSMGEADHAFYKKVADEVYPWGNNFISHVEGENQIRLLVKGLALGMAELERLIRES